MNIKKLSINDIQSVSTEDSVEFAIARIAVLSTKRNSHNINITKEILKRDGKSVLGKWLIADYNGYDATTHTPSEKIVGIFPTDSKIEFVDNDDGSTTMFVDAVISKIYATEIYNIFKDNNFRNVSVEMSTFDDFENSDGSIDISGLRIYGVTILGMSVAGSCPDANMSIIRFSSSDADEYYHNIIKGFTESQKNNKAISFQEKLNYKENYKEENMEDNMELEKEKNFSDSTGESDIMMESDDKTIDSQEQELSCGDEKVMSTDEEVVESSEKVMADISENEEKDEDVNDKDDDDDKDDDNDDKKEFSLSAYIDSDSISEIIKNESKETKSFAENIINNFSAIDIITELVKLSNENIELKAIKETYDNEKKEKKFSMIMASVKNDLDEDTYKQLSEEGTELTYEQLGAFENKVKAFAYEYSKKNKVKEQEKEDIEIMTFGASNNSEEVETDVFVRISKK